MKISVIAPLNLPIPAVKGGAIETLIDYFIDENIKANQYELNVFSYNDKNQVVKKNKFTNYVYIKRGLVSKVKYYMSYKIKNKLFCPTIITKALEYKTDVIIVEGNKYYVEHIPNNINSKIVLHIHHEAFRDRNETNYNILAKLDCIICVSEYIKNVCITTYPEFKDKFVVLRNCCNNDFFEIDRNINNIDIRKKYNIKDDEFIVTYIGRITREKGVKELMQAVEMCDNKTVLMIVGNSSFGAVKTSSYMDEVKKIIENSDRRIIFTGQVSHSEIPNYLLASNVQVVPSIWEDPAPLAVIEGVVLRIPLIVTNSGGILEYLPTDYKFIANKSNNLPSQLKVLIEEMKNYDRQIIFNDFNNIRESLSTKIYFEEFTKIINSCVNGGTK